MKFKVSVVKQGKPTKEIINKKMNINFLKKFSNKLSNGVSQLKEANRKQTEMNKLIDKWLEIMANCNVYNSEMKTFTLTHIKEEDYGYSCRIYCPYGLSFEKLTHLKSSIEDALPCMFLFKQKKGNNFVTANIISNGFVDTKFIPVKIKPYEIYIGNDAAGIPIIIDLNKWCHILIGGATGRGKSRLLDCIITNTIYNCHNEDIEIYLIQLDKNDLVIYEDVELCKGFADNLENTLTILTYIYNEIKERDKLVRPLRKGFKGNNITDYNAHNPKNKKSTILLVFDEMASLSDNALDSKSNKEMKAKINAIVDKIAQYGRSSNVFLFSCLQRPVALMLSPFVKSQSNLLISMCQTNPKSSEVIMGDSNIALNLPQQIAVYKTLDFDYLKTPFIDDKIINTYIKNKLNPNHKTIFSEIPINNTSENSNSTPQTNKPIKNNGKIKA